VMSSWHQGRHVKKGVSSECSPHERSDMSVPLSLGTATINPHIALRMPATHYCVIWLGCSLP
jgi:hypothetical protein